MEINIQVTKCVQRVLIGRNAVILFRWHSGILSLASKILKLVLQVLWCLRLSATELVLRSFSERTMVG